MMRTGSRGRARLAFTLVTAALVLALTPAVGAQQPVVVRVSGWGGTDIAIVEELITRFVQPAVEPEGIRVVYEPVAEAFDTVVMQPIRAATRFCFGMKLYQRFTPIRCNSVCAARSAMSRSMVIA